MSVSLYMAIFAAILVLIYRLIFWRLLGSEGRRRVVRYAKMHGVRDRLFFLNCTLYSTQSDVTITTPAFVPANPWKKCSQRKSNTICKLFVAV
ncbi:hypothetical protein DL89DRAFT_130064 [Linderina pennispora]|uniref:Uncharacterized protein n=1 Tax=Linderina pennispora TaxID=61395 RepID=A0A1Y1WER0_9FUNG|nr:uncharacterized protein DL89DRAFT_130064 [Linderina pennispora]ORX71654.1 hypothetical protein DL89DRAFT_130064 [Linderina pennispora]